jgi:hypothetical protein
MAEIPQLRLMSFAHLAGLGPRAGDCEPDDKDKDGRKGRKAEKDDEDPSRDDQDQGRKAEDDPPAEDDNQDGRRSRGRGRKAKDDDEDDEDDDKDDDEDDKDMKAARARERARCAAIFGDKAAGLNPALAASIAFGTSLPRSQAIQLLRNGVAGMRQPGLHDRMTGSGAADLRTSSAGAPAANRSQTIQSGWDAAAKRAGIRHGQ